MCCSQATYVESCPAKTSFHDRYCSLRTAVWQFEFMLPPVALNRFRQRESIVDIGSAKLLLSHTRGCFRIDMARHQPCKQDWRGRISLASTDLSRPVALNSFRQSESIVDIGSAKLLLSHIRCDFKFDMARHQPCKQDWRGRISSRIYRPCTARGVE